MRPIFTVHAGEYLVGSAIEKVFPNLRVWVPSKDDGIDLLVTNRNCKKTVSLQVKFSKDYFGNGVTKDISSGIRSGGWWSFNQDKITNSPADYWVLALYQFQNRNFDFVVIKPKDLANLYSKIYSDSKKIQSYVWVTSENKCWETRGLNKKEQLQVANGTFKNRYRDLSACLNNWSVLKDLTSR